jgi:hypothetical protein
MGHGSGSYCFLLLDRQLSGGTLHNIKPNTFNNFPKIHKTEIAFTEHHHERQQIENIYVVHIEQIFRLLKRTEKIDNIQQYI